MTQTTATMPTVITAAPIHPSLAVSDLAHSRRWYADKLGWEPTIEAPGTLVYVLPPGSAFTLYESEFAGTAKNTVMNWVVADVPAEVGRLRSNGVELENYDFGDIKTVDGIMTDPSGFMNAWFKDPDGNIVGLVSDATVPEGGVITTMIAAADIERAKAWYADKLGFQPANEMGGFVLDYRSGESRFEVYKTDFAGTARNTVGVWRLVGLRDEVDRLRANGVVFEDYDFGDGEKTVDGILFDASGEALTAWFKDADGNILAIAEDRN
ncbi:MAG TPA: VOC family protein [Candidatus Dormibacteraeota bacterium]|nr:VOC family protein [Candidatus Dormibacteraeota bacterium]